MSGMSYQPNFQPNLASPTPKAESLPQSLDTELLPAMRPENLPNPELTPSQAPQPSLSTSPMPASLPVDNSSPQQTTVQDDVPLSHGTSTVLPVGKDLIGKEWILRAKQISAQTRDDPYKQSIEFSKLKAEYIKQRYNLTLKSS